MMKLYRQRLFSDLNSSMSSVVLQYLGRLSGFISRAKSLHWGARGKDIHEYLDGLWKELYEFQDTVAEGFMGIGGQFAAQDVPYIPADEKINPQAFIREVEDKTLEFYNLLPADNPRYKGLCGETESFIQTIEKYKYLFGLCTEKDFSEKSEKLEEAADIAGTGVAGLGLVEALRYGKAQNQLAGEFESAEKMREAIDTARKSHRAIKLELPRTRVTDLISKIKAKKGKITKEELDLILDKGKNTRKDIRKYLLEKPKTTIEKVVKRGNATKAALLTSAGLLAAGTGLRIHNKAKKKKDNKDK